MVGKWTGTYQYISKRTPEEIRNRATKFEIEIIEFDGITFTGTVKDDLETGGMNGVGKIVGKIRDGIVEFVKEMPNQSVYLPDGSKIEEEKPHRKIYYSGKLSDNQIEGIWKFKFGIGKVRNRLAVFPRTKGTWKMKKTLV
jgi:hypothetical protein